MKDDFASVYETDLTFRNSLGSFSSTGYVEFSRLPSDLGLEIYNATDHKFLREVNNQILSIASKVRDQEIANLILKFPEVRVHETFHFFQIISSQFGFFLQDSVETKRIAARNMLPVIIQSMTATHKGRLPLPLKAYLESKAKSSEFSEANQYLKKWQSVTTLVSAMLGPSGPNARVPNLGETKKAFICYCESIKRELYERNGRNFFREVFEKGKDYDDFFHNGPRNGFAVPFLGKHRVGARQLIESAAEIFTKGVLALNDFYSSPNSGNAIEHPTYNHAFSLFFDAIRLQGQIEKLDVYQNFLLAVDIALDIPTFHYGFWKNTNWIGLHPGYRFLFILSDFANWVEPIRNVYTMSNEDLGYECERIRNQIYKKHGWLNHRSYIDFEIKILSEDSLHDAPFIDLRRIALREKKTNPRFLSLRPDWLVATELQIPFTVFKDGGFLARYPGKTVEDQQLLLFFSHDAPLILDQLISNKNVLDPYAVQFGATEYTFRSKKEYIGLFNNHFFGNPEVRIEY